jgi:hypothetical protein
VFTGLMAGNKELCQQVVFILEQRWTVGDTQTACPPPPINCGEIAALQINRGLKAAIFRNRRWGLPAVGNGCKSMAYLIDTVRVAALLQQPRLPTIAVP